MGVWWENYLGYALSSIKQWGKNIYVTHLQVDFINPSGLLYQPVKIRFLLGMPVFLYGQQGTSAKSIWLMCLNKCLQ
jgi:hypothetical protein